MATAWKRAGWLLRGGEQDGRFRVAGARTQLSEGRGEESWQSRPLQLEGPGSFSPRNVCSSCAPPRAAEAPFLFPPGMPGSPTSAASLAAGRGHYWTLPVLEAIWWWPAAPLTASRVARGGVRGAETMAGQAPSPLPRTGGAHLGKHRTQAWALSSRVQWEGGVERRRSGIPGPGWSPTARGRVPGGAWEVLAWAAGARDHVGSLAPGSVPAEKVLEKP